MLDLWLLIPLVVCIVAGCAAGALFIVLRARRVPKQPCTRREGARVYDMTRPQYWGDTVRWHDIAQRQIVGWCSPRPVPGDLCRSHMASGRAALFVITEVSYMRDPADMFFATVAQNPEKVDG